MKTFREILKTTSSLEKSTLEDMSLAPKGKGREAAKKLYKASYEEDELDELSIAQTQQRRSTLTVKKG